MPFDAIGRGKRRRQRSEAGAEQADSDRARKLASFAEAVADCPQPQTAAEHQIDQRLARHRPERAPLRGLARLDPVEDRAGNVDRAGALEPLKSRRRIRLADAMSLLVEQYVDPGDLQLERIGDRKSTRLNSSH